MSNDPPTKQSEESSDASSDLKRPTYNGGGMYRAGSVVRKSSADLEKNGSFRGSFRKKKKKESAVTLSNPNWL